MSTNICVDEIIVFVVGLTFLMSSVFYSPSRG